MAGTETKQLVENGRQLIKAFEGGEPASALLALLAPLEKVTVTEDLLRSSKIGVAVAKLRTSKDPQVASKSSQLVNKWRAAVGNKKKPAAGSSPSVASSATLKGGAANGAAQNGRSGTGSPAPVKKEAANTFIAAPEKRTAKEDGVDVKVTGNPTRDGSVTLIYNGLCFMSEESPSDILAVAQRVENAAFDKLKPETTAAYKTKARTLFMNMKMKENTWLREGVFTGRITPERLVAMTSEELKSADKKEADKKLNQENMNAAMTPVEEKAISTTMTCGKCKQSRVAYSQAQTRSADEPMTTFCECTMCGHRWKFS